VTKEEIIEAIRKCAQELGRAPKRNELEKMCGVPPRRIALLFRGMTKAVRAAGLEPAGGPGYAIKTDDLMLDWARLARKLKKRPSLTDYKRRGRYTHVPFLRRWGAWTAVPETFRKYARVKGMEGEWKDVLAIIAALKPAPAVTRAISSGGAIALGPGADADGDELFLTEAALRAARRKHGLYRDRPVTGAPLPSAALAHEPVNESAVIFFFGMYAHMLGFRVLSLQGEFPDCEAMQEVRPGMWQRVRIEIEFESRNFQKHGHRVDGCDVIVCWRHNWPGCPKNIQVVELSRLVRRSK